MALDTTANEKIVFAKSYSDHATATRARPDVVSPPSRAPAPSRSSQRRVSIGEAARTPVRQPQTPAPRSGMLPGRADAHIGGTVGAMPKSVLTPAIREEIARLERADIMVGIPSFKNATTIGYVVRAAQAGLVQYFPDLRPVVVNSDAGSPDGTGRVVVETEPPDYVERILLVRPTNKLSRVSLTYPEIDGVGGKGAALRTIFEIAAALEVQALVVVDSDLRTIGPEWIELLAGPILKGGYDYVAPLYARHKHDGTITNNVTYPLTRALYGLRIRQPIGGDFGVSGDLVRHYLEAGNWTPEVSKFGIDIWMTTLALTGGFAVCQARLGAKVHDPKDPGADLGPMFRQVVTTILRMAVANADRWQGVKGSHDVPGVRVRADRRPAAARDQRPAPAVRVPRRRADPRRHVARDALRRDGRGRAGLAEEAGRIADHVREALDMDGPGREAPSTAAMADAGGRLRVPRRHRGRGSSMTSSSRRATSPTSSRRS